MNRIATGARLIAFAAITVVAAPGCSQPPDPEGIEPDMNGSSADAEGLGDTGADATPPTDARQTDTSGDVDEIAASEYCETTAELFCDYYLRCGRMAADSPEDCRATFLESCNEVYEPQYVSYVDRGLLELSAEGIDACRSHLEMVDCEVQLFDLDLGCADIWVGTSSAGAACAPGIGSFVCEPGTVCTLELSLCGSCSEAAELDEPCGGEVRCEVGAQCVDSVCTRRPLPGENCNTVPCVTGASCQDGICVGFQTVAVGDECDQNRRCPYKASCRRGVCVESALLGEDCSDRACASGWCDDGTCAPFKAPGDPCSAPSECQSLVCDETCGEIARRCF